MVRKDRGLWEPVEGALPEELVSKLRKHKELSRSRRVKALTQAQRHRCKKDQGIGMGMRVSSLESDFWSGTIRDEAKRSTGTRSGRVS